MKDLQTVFNELQEMKHERKRLQAVYKDALHNSEEYIDAVDKAKEAREHKKAIE